MKRASLWLFAISAAIRAVSAQTEPAALRALLEHPIQQASVVRSELEKYLIAKAPRITVPGSADLWTAEAQRLRKRILNEIVLHGWPREWVEAPARFEDLGVIPGNGYRIRKLRYEIVPGFYSTALLYEPAQLSGKAPAVLNVNGHGNPGKALEYKQKRCINQALRGMFALNLEWIYFGELNTPENAHWFGAHLDLAGASAAGLFYLAMRKGLDFLYQHPNVDQNRIAMTGLSGGGWQTIMLSSLDERVRVAIPVAGYSAVISRISRPSSIGDIEQNPTDMLAIADYSHLTAMRAPRPTLLIYNAEDDCCFRGPLVKPFIYDEIKPFFRLFKAEEGFQWHLNTDPANHNYQLDNRQQAYRFLSEQFGLPGGGKEIPVAEQIKSPEELAVGLPPGNLTILGLARKLASEIRRGDAAPSEAQREKLRRTLRLQEVKVERAWGVANTYAKGLETRSYRLRFNNGLSASAVWLKALSSPDQGSATIVLNDKGRKAAAVVVSDRVNRGEQVLALDPLFTGDSEPENPGARGYAQLMATLGDRPLGLEAAQLMAAAGWLRSAHQAAALRLETEGIRSQVAGLAAAALDPQLFSEMIIRGGMASFRHLLDAPVEYASAPDLFCLDLYKDFDLDVLTRMAGPTEVSTR